MSKSTKRQLKLDPTKSSNYYKFVYFISEKLIIWTFLMFILLSFNNSLLLQKAVIALVLTFATSEAIKGVYIKKRPVHPLLGHKIDSSFPSSHAAVAFCFFFSYLFFTNNYYAWILFFTCAVFTGVGRVLGGAHFKVDVIGGAVLAGICTYIVYILNLSVTLSF